MYELTGKIKRIGELQMFASGFTKREVVVEQPGGERGPIPTPVVFKGDDVSLVDVLAKGSEVKVCFSVEGHEWQDPKTNRLRCFCDLTAHKVEVIAVPLSPDELKGTVEGVEEGEMPF